MAIRIKTLFGEWREVTEEQAGAWARHMTAHSNCALDRAWLAERVEGATVQELMTWAR